MTEHVVKSNTHTVSDLNKAASEYIAEMLAKENGLNVVLLRHMIMTESDNNELLKQYKMAVSLSRNDTHLLLSSAINHIDRSPETEREYNAKYALSLLEKCSKRKHDAEGVALYSAKAYFTLGDYKSCFIHLNKYCNITKKSDDEASLIVLAISKSEIPQVEKYVSDLRKKGYSIFIKEVDEKEKRSLVHGVLFESN
ncbi:MAG: hypothetical protein KF721_12485 [Ignavibacteriaceae bacterium]|nr:hypothetical protein [Ignavibacteriaceae bacterium]